MWPFFSSTFVDANEAYTDFLFFFPNLETLDSKETSHDTEDCCDDVAEILCIRYIFLFIA